MMRTREIAVITLMLAFCLAANAEDRKHIVKPRPAGLSAVPFSDAVLVGNTLYIAGHIGLDSKTGMAPADPEQEAHMVMDGFKQTVEQAGFTMDDVVTVQVFCTDLKLYETFNNVYKTYFHGEFPARAFIGAGSLLRGGHFEVLGTAIKKGQ
jgi:2-iminobutanoate/2-iminopropanoate deaminase